ncbi:MAG: hypothetical protein ACE37J_14130 [Pikeienuella sp.]|uniref:hypothetical protein n=1 Tax=Pikeienuella sp. TaxID=2831957 RepID=UPI00391C2CBE
MPRLALPLFRILAPALLLWAGWLALAALFALVAGSSSGALVAPLVALAAGLAAERHRKRLEAGMETDPMIFGAWLFAAVGGLFALVGGWIAQDSPDGWFMAGFGFVFVGIGRLVEGLIGGRLKPEAFEPAPPRPAAAPAPLRVDPAPQGLRRATLPAAAAAAFGALLLTAGAASLGGFGFAVAAAFLWRASGGAAAARKFPAPTLLLDCPPRPGAALAGAVETGAPPEMFGDGRFRFVIERRGGAPWRRAKTFQVTEAEPGRPVLVPFAFDLPDVDASGWRLSVFAAAPGVDYEAAFDLAPD